MALVNTAKTRLGVGGPSKNYTRPVAAKGGAPVAAAAFKPVFRPRRR